MQPFFFTRPSFTIATACFLVSGLGLRIKLMMQNLRIKTKCCVCPGTSQKKHISTLFQYRLKKERERNLRELESERRTRMRKRARSRTTFFLQLLKCFINQPEHIQGKFRIVINLFFSIFMFFPPWYQCFLMMYVQLEIWRRKEWNCECVKVSQTNVTNWTF